MTRHALRCCPSCQRRLPRQCWQIITPTGATFKTCSVPCMRALVTAAESALTRWIASTVVAFPTWRPSRRSAIDAGRPYGVLGMADVVSATGTDG